MEPLYYGHFGTLILVLITEVSSIQRSLNTLQYYTGTQDGVLITENSAIQRFVIERFHCSTSQHVCIVVLDNNVVVSLLHLQLTALRSSYDKLVEEITTLEERNLELMGDLLSASESVPSEAMVPVIADTSGVLGGPSGAGRRTALSSRKESRGSNIEQWQNRQIQLWEDVSILF